MRIAYLDLVGGLSGDMWLAALIAAGLPVEKLQAFFRQLPGGLKISVKEVSKGGFYALQISLKAEGGAFPNRYPEIRRLLDNLPLKKGLKEKAGEIFHRLFEAEARVHGRPLEEVHLHEVAAYDTLGDILGVLYGLEELEIGEIWASPVPIGRGLLQGAHGPLPLPAPATLELLKGFELYGIAEEAETITPTGAVLFRNLVTNQGPCPRMRLEAVGLGAGHRELATRPNVLRLFVGEASFGEDLLCEGVIELETNLDDQPPEMLAEAAARILAAGALDVGFGPFFMKKGRPGYTLSVLARPGDETRLARMILDETGSLGVRLREVRRFVLPREIREIPTPWGKVRVKISRHGGKKYFKPEFEDVKALAQKEGKPLREMYQELYSFLAKSSRKNSLLP